MTLPDFQTAMGLDPVDMARDLGVTEERLMELLREVGEPMTDAERNQIETGCLGEYGVSPATMEAP